MFNPKFRVTVTSDSFPQDEVICLGTQLISIIISIKNVLPEHIWYGADVDAFGKSRIKYNLNDTQLNIIGTDLQFIEYCYEIDQFIWGVFLCINKNFLPQNIQGVELSTEDESFRPIACDGVLIEIRAFDTTFFEIYSEDKNLISKISKIYNIEIEKNES
jgi:hypothetical protein